MLNPLQGANYSETQSPSEQVSGTVSRGILPQGLAICVLLMGLSEATAGTPEIGWWVSWLSGCILLFLCLKGFIFEIPQDVPWRHQILRPWFLALSIFTGYNFLTSIFYWLDLHGHYFIWEKTRFVPSINSIKLAAAAQQLYLVGQIGLALGLGAMLRWNPKTRIRSVPSSDLTRTLLIIGASSFAAMLFFRFIPGFSQFTERAQGLMVIAIATSLGIAYRTNSAFLTISLMANALLAILALASGWKEEVLVLVILNAVAFFPRHPFMTSLATSMLFLAGFVL